MEVDLRSISEDELVRLDAFFRRMVREAVEQENSSRRKDTPPLELNLSSDRGATRAARRRRIHHRVIGTGGDSRSGQQAGVGTSFN